MITDILQQEFYHNRVSHYLVCLAILSGGALFIWAIEALALRRLKRWIVAGIFREVEGAALDRVHFFSYGDFSLVYEIVHYVDGNDYTRYMDVQQKVNLRIYEEFGKRGIGFAYPTQTLYLNQA